MVGYRSCSCGQLVLEYSWHLMGGVCLECWGKGKARNVRVTELINEGRRVNLPTRRRKRYGSRGRGSTQNDRKAAKLAALKRLGNIYPAMFAMLYAEERLKRGLPPVPLRTYEGVAAKGAETCDWEPVYAALLEQETADGPS